MPPTEGPVSKPVGELSLLMIDMERPHPTVGTTISGQDILHGMKKEAEEAVESK